MNQINRKEGDCNRKPNASVEKRKGLTDDRIPNDSGISEISWLMQMESDKDRSSGSFLKASLVDSERFDSGIQSGWRHSQFCSRSGRPGNSALGLCQDGFNSLLLLQ
jgi:hypothetical protein